MSAKGPASLYDVLGLAPGASAQDVRQAWRRLAQQHHPDRGEVPDSEAMALINQAYDVLSDTDRRARYDFGRFRATEPRQPGRVRLPADRTKARLAWAAAATVVAASGAAWALMGLPDGPAADRPAPDPTRAAGAAAQARPASPPRPLPVQGQAAEEPPLRLIPASRIEAREAARQPGPAPAERHAQSGERRP